MAARDAACPSAPGGFFAALDYYFCRGGRHQRRDRHAGLSPDSFDDALQHRGAGHCAVVRGAATVGIYIPPDEMDSICGRDTGRRDRLVDQMPPAVSDQDIASVAQIVESDRKFTEAMEQHLPAGAMIFQLPVVDFPESAVPGVGPYDHFRPYLFAHRLRFSYGTNKGRADGEWQHEKTQLPFGVMINELVGNGFSALYVNRNGFGDQGQKLLSALKSMGYTDEIDSQRGDLVCVILKK